MYRLTLPASFGSRGARHIAEESRTVEVWSGTLGGDAPVTVAVNLMPLAGRRLGQILDRAAAGLRAATVEPSRLRVPGATRSARLDGVTRSTSPAEPEHITIVAAVVGREVVVLTVRRWPRDDIETAVARIVASLAIVRPGSAREG